jgi:hypothetical protein
VPRHGVLTNRRRRLVVLTPAAGECSGIIFIKQTSRFVIKRGCFYFVESMPVRSTRESCYGVRLF